jgi:hypothetical protein
VVAGNAFRKREGIADINLRAAQFVEDGLRIGAMAMFREESSAEFIAAVLRAFDGKLSQPGLPEEVAERCRFYRQHLEFNAASAKPPAADGVAHLRAASISPDELTEADTSRSLSMYGASELISALERAVISARDELQRAADETDGPPGTAEFTSALRSLLAPADEASPDEVETLVAHAAACAPGTTVVYGDEQFPAAEAVRRGAAGEKGLLCVVAGIALRAAQHGKDEGFWLSLTRLLVRLQRRDDPDAHVVRFLSFALCGEFFGMGRMPVLSAGAYAAAVLSFQPSDSHAVRTPADAMPIAAILWQRLGRLLDHFGNTEQALMCAQNSARLFEIASWTDGVVTSSLDALRFTLQLPPSAELIASARALLARIRRLNEENTGEYASSEAICLSMLGEALFRSSKEPPKLLIIKYGDEERAEGTDEQPASQDEPRQQTAEGSERGGESEAEAAAEFYNRIERDFALAQETADSAVIEQGYILATRIVLPGDVPFIARLLVKGVKWFDCYREALELAARHGRSDLWFNIQLHVY